MDMDIKKVSLIGLGAVGTLYAHLLSQKMPADDLRVIADAARIERYRRDGIFCNGVRCDFHYVTTDEDPVPADLLLVTTKFTGLAAAIPVMAPHVGPDTIILSALNGITSEEVLADAFGPQHVLYAVAAGMDATKIGNQLIYTQKGTLTFGEKEPGLIGPRALAVKDFFDRTGFPYVLADDMLHRQWSKLMLNVGLNQAAAVFDLTYGDLQKDCRERELMLGAMEEVRRVAERRGYPIPESEVGDWMNVLARLSPGGKPSMAQDRDARRKSEVELLAGTICRLGQQYGIATPINDFFYEKITERERSY